MELSPFEVDLDEDQRDKTAENLARLAALPDPPGRFRFAFVSDNHQAYDELASIVNRLNDRSDLELVLHGGDMVDVGLRREFIWTLDELERLDRPYFTVVGNHDALSNGKLVYESMFGPEDYTFEHGSVTFVCFNSNEKEYPGAPRLGWLDARTKLPATQHVVALTHVPPNSMHHSYEPTLVDNGVELALSGHLDGFTLRSAGQTTFFRVDSVRRGSYALVSLGGGEPIAIEACTSDGCTPYGGP
jgi:3',5'-cyclic AMP phosphodiesterase CpdA